jgi:hypothetical protein
MLTNMQSNLYYLYQFLAFISLTSLLFAFILIHSYNKEVNLLKEELEYYKIHSTLNTTEVQ